MHQVFISFTLFSPDCRSWDPLSKNCRLKTLHYLSTNSILLYENAEESMKDPKMSLQQVCNQIFIGMVAMQYQARPVG